MAKKFSAVFTALAIALILVLGVSAGAAAQYSSVITDLAGVLTDDEEKELKQYLIDTAKLAECNVGVIITDDIHGKSERAYTEDMYDSTFGADSDGVLLLINNDYDSGYGDWLTAEGNAVARFGNKSDKVLQAVYDGLNSGGFCGAVKGFCDYLRSGVGESYAYRAVLSDLDGVLTASQTDELCELMTKTANEIEVNIGVVITDDLQGKSDEKYADDFLDDSFGFGSSSIVFLFNNDRSNMNYTDMISACGNGSNKFDRNADNIMDMIYDGLGDDDYYSGIKSFCSALKTYAGSGSSTSVDSPVTDYNNSTDIMSRLKFMFIPCVVGLILAIAVTCGVASTYKRKAPVSAAQYMDNSRTRFLNKSDIFIREFHTSHRVNSNNSSGGRHSGGGGHHSRSHSSHSHHGGRRR